MNVFLNVNQQSQYAKFVRNNNINNKVKNNPTSEPQEDTLIKSEPSFKGNQVSMLTQKFNKGKVALLTATGALFASLATKVAAKKEEITQKSQIKEMANELASTVYYDRIFKNPYLAYNRAEAEGIAHFMFEAPEVFKQLKNELAHRENQSSNSFINNVEDVLYLGNKMKSENELVSKFAEVTQNYKETIEFLKIQEINPKALELKEEFKHLTSSEVNEVLPTYEKYPVKTKALLDIQEQIRELKDKINAKISDLKSGYYGENEKYAKANHEDAKRLCAELVNISPEYIKNEIEAQIKDGSRNSYANLSIPDIAITDIITAVEENPVKNLRELI